VQLVDEQDDVAAGLDFLQHLLQALFEVTAVPAARHERAEIKRVELLVGQRLGDDAGNDVLGKALDDRGLADAGLADQHGIVLRATTQHLHDALDFLRATDDRVEFLLARELGEVAPELIEHQRTRRRCLARRTTRNRGGGFLAAGVATQKLNDLLAHTRQIRAEFHEDLGGDALTLANQAEEDVLGADVIVAELQRLAERQLKHLLRAGREGDVAGRRAAAVANDLFDLGAHGLQRDTEGFQRLRRDTLTLVDQTQEDVFGADVVVVQQARFFLRQYHHSSGSVCETFEHCGAHLPCEAGIRVGRFTFGADARFGCRV
jgi:hypothetical protein